MMLQKEFLYQKHEEVGMGKRDVKKSKDRVLIWAEYIMLCIIKYLLVFKPNIFYTFCDFVPMPLFIWQTSGKR